MEPLSISTRAPELAKVRASHSRASLSMVGEYHWSCWEINRQINSNGNVHGSSVALGLVLLSLLALKSHHAKEENTQAGGRRSKS